uniref:K Homology domain-containing protein n=1 Tax=Ciona savignyi TaxID=51511 RepID=H2YJL0_CIOSA
RDIMSETIRLPDDLVGLIIGRGGENIMRMQRETGCRIQITQSIPGTKERPCTLSGTPEQIEYVHFLYGMDGGMGGGMGGGNMGGMGDGVEKSIEIAVPPDKCGLIIGKGGETIKMLQQSLGVKMLLIQDSTDNIGQSKPLRITGAQMNLDPNMFGDDVNKTIIPVPKAAVGVVIGKGGDMINQIQNVTGTRIQFKPGNYNISDIFSLIHHYRLSCNEYRVILPLPGNRSGGGGGGGPPGGMGSFGQWEGPNMGRGNRGMGVSSEEHLVPANKTGLVIGKGGDTIKQINMQSGAHAEIQRNPPPGSDLNYKTFIIKGTPEQIKMCRQLIQEKVDAGPGGQNNGQMQSSHMGGQPPMGNFGPPQQQGGYGGLPPAASYGHPNPLQGPPQAPQAPQSYQQPWGSQFQQWSSPSVSAPQQNGADPNSSNAAAWQSYLQMYGAQAQAAYQQPTAAAAVSAAPASQPDYSKQWDEYLKQNGELIFCPTRHHPGNADYSAAWAEYYRQYYAMHGQAGYAAAAAAAGQ